MRERVNIGFVVSKHSSLFPLVREINLLAGFKGWKMWEERTEHVSKNDIVVIEDVPDDVVMAAAIRDYVRKGGALVQLFSPGDDVEGVIAVENGHLLPGFEGMFGEGEGAAFLASHDDLVVHVLSDAGIIVSFSRNVFTSGDEVGDDRPRQEREQAMHVQQFAAMTSFLVSRRQVTAVERARQLQAPTSKHAIFIHGPSLWLGGTVHDVETIVRAVFSHLGIEDMLPQVFKEPSYRQVPPEHVEAFPEIVYYHRAFPEDDAETENELAATCLDQARKVHATVRTERLWDMNVVPTFFHDIASLAYHDEPSLKRVYLFPPAVILERSKDANELLLRRCVLEPLAPKGVSSFLVSGTGSILPATVPGKVKARVSDPGSHVVLLHGPELVNRYKDTSNEDMLRRMEALGWPDRTMKVLVHVVVDKLDMQRRIKDQSFGMKKADERSRERIKRLMERNQERLHAHVHVSKDKQLFEKHGFTVIEVDDSMHVDQDVKIFMIDQVLPLVLSRKVSRVHHVLPPELASFLEGITRPLLGPAAVDRLEA